MFWHRYVGVPCNVTYLLVALGHNMSIIFGIGQASVGSECNVCVYVSLVWQGSVAVDGDIREQSVLVMR